MAALHAPQSRRRGEGAAARGRRTGLHAPKLVTPGRLAGLEASLAAKLNLTPEQVRWHLYGPQAQQYIHALAYGSGAITVAPDKPVTAEMSQLKRGLESDTLLGL